jgi:exopolyphosphatase/guanosine-5'-triphosphate,3'-diphosphate pyrophosphatase
MVEGRTMRVGAIDCGTNSIRLLIADIDGDHFAEVDRRMEIVRLGEGVDRTGTLSAVALDRTFAACDRYAEVLSLHGVTQLRFVATSASRDASNRYDFIAGVRARLGIDPEVITGAEEAALSFTGAVRGLRNPVALPTLVVDIGGGSTEFVLGADLPIAAMSVDIGCVRLTERHLRADPPSSASIDATIADIDAAIDRAAESVPLDQAKSLLGLAGSVTTLAAIALDLLVYDPAVLHGSILMPDQVARVTADLLHMTRAERAVMTLMHDGRVDVIGGGALILDRIVRRVGLPVVVSETDILDGIAWSMAKG